MSTNLHELFARDPREHTDADILVIIEGLREMRQKFVHDGSRIGSTKQLTEKQAQVSKLDLDVKL